MWSEKEMGCAEPEPKYRNSCPDAAPAETPVELGEWPPTHSECRAGDEEPKRVPRLEAARGRTGDHPRGEDAEERHEIRGGGVDRGHRAAVLRALAARGPTEPGAAAARECDTAGRAVECDPPRL